MTSFFMAAQPFLRFTAHHRLEPANGTHNPRQMHTVARLDDKIHGGVLAIAVVG